MAYPIMQVWHLFILPYADIISLIVLARGEYDGD
jgi:hypothetical protein